MSERNDTVDRDRPDLELVADYRAGSDYAFGLLVQRYQLRLFRVLLGMVRDPALAEELCQRVLVKAALRIDQLRDGVAFYGWLLAIARATALDELRKQKHRRYEPLEAVHEEGRASGLDVRQTVNAVLAEMTPEDRMAVILADLQELAMDEVAEALGVKLSAAKMRVKRARERFRAIYGERT